MEWIIRFRIVRPEDFGVPMCFNPVEGTGLDAESLDEAREAFFDSLQETPRDWIEIVDILPAPTQKPEGGQGQ